MSKGFGEITAEEDIQDSSHYKAYRSTRLTMNSWVTFAVLLCCLAVTTAVYHKRSGCVDNYPSEQCQQFVEQDTCHTLEARENCGVTCEACGKACMDWHSKCKNQDVKEELCGDTAAAFMICARSCGLCSDQ